MNTKSRTEERDDLLTSLGLLVDPIRRLVFGGEDPAPMIPYIRSQFLQDREEFRQRATEYCRVGKHGFGAELDGILREAKRFYDFLGEAQHPELREDSKRKFPELLKSVQRAIRAVPCEDAGAMLPAESPLQTYYRLRAICSRAIARLDLFDPYLDADVFHRYLRGVPEQTFLRVISSERTILSPPGQQGVKRRDEILAVSELIALERPSLYGFYVTSRQHDRHLRVDSQILHLGGSIKDASKLVGSRSPSEARINELGEGRSLYMTMLSGG